MWSSHSGWFLFLVFSLWSESVIHVHDAHQHHHDFLSLSLSLSLRWVKSCTSLVRCISLYVYVQYPLHQLLYSYTNRLIDHLPRFSWSFVHHSLNEHEKEERKQNKWVRRDLVSTASSWASCVFSLFNLLFIISHVCLVVVFLLFSSSVLSVEFKVTKVKGTTGEQTREGQQKCKMQWLL